MVRETYLQGEFCLTRFYLNNLKYLEEIQNNGSFEISKNELREFIHKKVKSF